MSELDLSAPPLGAAAQAFVDRKNFQMFIDGAWVDAGSGETFDTIDPATGDVTAQIAKASPADVDNAVAAARSAFDDGRWSGMIPAQRAAILSKIADLIEANIDELAELETLDQGKP